MNSEKKTKRKNVFYDTNKKIQNWITPIIVKKK